MKEKGTVVGSSKTHGFQFADEELYASALRAQVVERCRRGLNHDMNNVVQSMHSGLELLSKCIASPGIVRITPQECIALLQQQFVTLQQALDKLMNDLAPTTGDPESVDLSQLATDAVHTLRHERAVAKARLSIKPDMSALARRSNVRTVMLALILDAADRLRGDETLEIMVDRDREQVFFQIRGSSSAQSNDSPHMQGDAGRSLPQIATRLLDVEGGVLHVLEESSHSVVRMQLPGAVIGTGNRANSRPAAASVGGNFRVLIADRNKDAADSLAMLLQLEGHEAKSVYNGIGLCNTIANFAPHLVLLDTDLGGCDVLEVARSIRRDRTGKLPMLAQVSSTDRARQEEFDAHLMRPVEWPQLEALVAVAAAG